MSRKFRTSDQNNYKRAITSTPTGNVPIFTKFHSTSISEIDTVSTSSIDRSKGISQLPLKARKATKRTKKALKNKKESIKGNKKRIRLDDKKQETSLEWETESEESIDEVFTHSRDSSPTKSYDTRIKLFEDPYSPEKIRDAPIVHESPLAQSPIYNSPRKFRSISRTTIVRQDNEKLLPVNIPSSDISGRNPEDTDEEITFNRTENVKTYSSARRPPRSIKYSLLDDDNLNLVYPKEYFTATSDLLWEKFVEKNYEEVSQYLAPSTSREPAKKYESEFLKKYPDIPPKFEDVPVPRMTRIREYFDNVSQMWITCVSSESESKEDDVHQTKAKKGKKGKDKKDKRKPEKRSLTLESVRDKIDIYNPLNETVDIEFETGGQGGKRISLSEFRKSQKKNE